MCQYVCMYVSVYRMWDSTEKNELSNYFPKTFFGYLSCLYILEPNPWSETYFVNIISQSAAFIFLKFPQIVEEQNNFFIL